jgi:hypothetical protein
VLGGWYAFIIPSLIFTGSHRCNWIIIFDAVRLKNKELGYEKRQTQIDWWLLEFLLCLTHHRVLTKPRFWGNYNATTLQFDVHFGEVTAVIQWSETTAISVFYGSFPETRRFLCVWTCRPAAIIGYIADAAPTGPTMDGTWRNLWDALIPYIPWGSLHFWRGPGWQMTNNSHWLVGGLNPSEKY